MTPEDILKRPYTIRLVYDAETDGWAVDIEELSGCVNQGDTPAEAVARILRGALTWIEIEQERGHDIPEPRPFGKSMAWYNGTEQDDDT